MWLENNENEIVKSESLWVRTQRFDTIGHREEPVYHTITVRTLSNKTFLAAGVFVGLTGRFTFLCSVISKAKCTIIIVIKTITKFSNVIGSHQLDLCR